MACTIKPAEIKRVKAPGCLHNKDTDLFNIRVVTRNGKITAQQARVLAGAAEKFGSGEVEFTTRLTVEVRGVHFDNIEPFREYIAQAGLKTGGTGAKVRPVVSCKGTTCQYGLYDTFELSEKIHERFYEGYHDVTLPHKFKIATGGCPNNCVKPNLNDVGVVGKMIPKLDADACRKCKKCQVEAVCPMKAAKAEDGAKILHMECRFRRFLHRKMRCWIRLKPQSSYSVKKVRPANGSRIQSNESDLKKWKKNCSQERF